MTDEQLSALLRLKRHETPPPGYFDRLLADVHDRQRTELLRQPLWKIAFERFQTFFGSHSMGPLSYAGAVASVVAVSALGTGAVHTWVDRAELTAANTSRQRALEMAPSFQEAPASNWQLARLSAPAIANPLPESRAPRYVIDARPVSYERPSSF